MAGTPSDTDPVLAGDVERMQLEVLRLRDLVRGQAAQIDELVGRLTDADDRHRRSEQAWRDLVEETQRELAAAHRRSAALQASTSWRIGQFLLRPVGWWRRVRRQ